MIYFLRHIDSGLVKIGYTTNIRDRVQLLSTDYGVMEVLGLMEGDRHAERNLHWLFGKWRARFQKQVEWFHLSDEIRQYIAVNATLPISDDLHRLASIQRKPSGAALLKALAEKQKRDGCEYESEQVAATLRMSSSVVGRLMAGNHYGISRRSMKRYVAWLGCTIDDLLPGEDQPYAIGV